MDGARATVDAVRAALTSHASVHIACHAASDPDDPSAGHLLLHDGRLSLLDLSGLELSGVRLAVLSACETSLGAPRIPDESLHLVSAFQLAGYPQVVGTLWQVNDRVARLVSVDLHRGLRRARTWRGHCTTPCGAAGSGSPGPRPSGPRTCIPGDDRQRTPLRGGDARSWVGGILAKEDDGPDRLDGHGGRRGHGGRAGEDERTRGRCFRQRRHHRDRTAGRRAPGRGQADTDPGVRGGAGVPEQPGAARAGTPRDTARAARVGGRPGPPPPTGGATPSTC
ncbi:CHAT domain-containing protein [Streptomyces sp. PG2]